VRGAVAVRVSRAPEAALGRLDGRVALVTGGGTGIGRATALRLAEEGASVAVSGRRADPLRETAAAIESAGGRALAVPGDVSLEADADGIVAATAERYGRLDVLVNNAGAIRRNVLLHELPTERWDEQIASNLRSVFLVTRAALRRMLEAEGDRSIVNVSSTFALAAGPGVAAYAAAKGGVVSLTRALAIEYAPQRIRVNCVCPGIVLTPLASVDRPGFDERKEEFARTYPLGRLGEPEDVAGAIAYLASADASWVTGVVLEVDGGFTAQ
jgi:NAD(P)-dependent dehydrogenase (short-subunit alcohol dehydrogenase family)